MSTVPDNGLIAVVKRDCPTCELTAPVLGDLAKRIGLQVYTQDDPTFPETVPERIDDTGLDISHSLRIEVVPTLIRLENGREIDRTYGWDRGEWERVAGIAGLGADLPESRPGCGAKNIEPGVIERLKIRFNETGLRSRRIEIGGDEDEQEAMYERGWSDGLSSRCSTAPRAIRRR
jgi:thiol-disulfide isomerase/thioredoxin